VKCVAHGADALVLLEQVPVFALILSDLTLPGMEATQLYWEIGSRWPQLASRLICLTDGHDAGAIDPSKAARGLGPSPGEAVPA
jgi:CheY-like chemotaxis protein